MRHSCHLAGIAPIFTLFLCAIMLTACPANNETGTETGLGGRHKISKAGVSKGTPLAAATATGTGFTALDAAKTGLDFTNVINDPRTMLRGIATQSGLTAGDYDNDGDFDIYILGLNNGNKLFRNDGNFHFTDVTNEAGTGLDGGPDAMGSGACFADLNGDGWQDLYVCNRHGVNQLFMNDGKGHFTDDAVARGVDSKLASVSATPFDADHDGDLDLYVCNYREVTYDWETGMINLERTLGQNDPVLYAKLQKLGATGLREDGKKITDADLPPELREIFYVTGGGRIRGRPQPDQFFINDGTGHFTENTQNAGLMFEGWSLAAHVCDMDNDGWPDIYVASDLETVDRLFMNNHDGTFTDKAPELTRKSPLFSMGVDSGDINHDGLPDFYTADMLSSDYKRAKRQSGDMYAWRYELLYDKPQPQMRNQFFLNRGKGYFTELGQMMGVAASEWTWSTRVSDLNSDGTDELYASNGVLWDVMDVDTLNQLKAKRAAGASRDVLDQIRFSTPTFQTDDVIFTADKPLHYQKAPDNWGVHDGAMSCGILLDDFDGDGDLDLISNNTNKPMGAWRNDMPQGNQLLLDLREEGGNPNALDARVWVTAGDETFTQDVLSARGFVSGESPRLHFGLGTHDKVDKVVIRWPDLTTQEVEGLTVNNLYTITKPKNLPQWEAPQPKPLFTQASLPFTQHERDTQKDEFKQEPLLPIQCSVFGTGAGAADYDGDGHLDLYFAGPAGMQGQLLKGDGKGGFTPDTSFPGAYPADAEEMAVLWFDADGDGRSDLLVTAGGMEAPVGSNLYGAKLFLNTTAGFKEQPLPARTISTGSAAAADVDGDGDLDLLLCGHLVPHQYLRTAPSALYLNDGKGNFTDASKQFLAGVDTGRPISEAQFGDINGDGKPDLVLARFFGPVELWTGDGKAFHKAADMTESGLWRSLGIGDFDNDGDLDVIAGNLGKNTKYSPKPNAPVQLFANDFDGNGTRDLIEVKYSKIDGKDCALPSRGRSCSGYAISYIPKKWPTWADFANATLEDVYGPGLKNAERYEATKVTSVICVNDGKGTFTVNDLPGTAQWAPGFGVAVADFDCDGNLDAFMGNNFRPSQPEAGNWDTGFGVLLKGDGKGGFADVQPLDSGLYFPWDNRSVLAADFSGDELPDLVVSMSDSQAQLGTRTTNTSGGTPLLVTLHGKAPNTAGVGARVELTLADGRKLNRSVQAGCGYMGSIDGPVSFGVPTGTTATQVTVTWADGSQSTETKLEGGKVDINQK